MEDSGYDTLELTELKNSECCNKEYNMAYQAIGEIEETFKELLTIAKAREWLSITYSTKKVRPWTRFSPKLAIKQFFIFQRHGGRDINDQESIFCTSTCFTKFHRWAKNFACLRDNLV